MSDLVALVDMDGTIADYDSAIERDMEKLQSPQETSRAYLRGADYPFMRERIRLVRNQAGWWENLEPLEDGLKLVDMLRKHGFDLHILTKGPSSSPNAWSEKVAWCRKYLPGVPVTITADKGLVYGRVLADDWPPYIEAWLKWRPRGLVIMPDWPWNKGFKHPNVVRYTGENLEEISTRLTHAAQREVGKS